MKPWLAVPELSPRSSPDDRDLQRNWPKHKDILIKLLSMTDKETLYEVELNDLALGKAHNTYQACK